MHRNAEVVSEALRAAGAEPEVVELTAPARTAAEAAGALGCPVGAIASSLLFLADGDPVLVLTSGAHRVDPEHTAAVLGARELTRPGAAAVRAATGQPIGGVAPVGHPTHLRTVVDVDLLRYDVVWAAAGTPRTVFPTTYAELLRICDAEPVTVQP
ncbi:prolyl-tRNA editing enzyme YbaK/EbsC (Cys-tRNA(Pro) deacylase) [Kineococcus radiotolerans]|uniref:YbaK/prolyl-tRNA synthetase associated region n=2 Tax=Kineococcus radiotolerans TaxID=131568 RepID=A6W613_KINRD|nr:YbaK/EbsC family protein [Kineococcus radiotolerans]ABS02252.1 YbaK/prolyl-tRNA synthetase associated region [Kineococcus radiotolerans SRS30216 = ATCC BAA-149]MBB2900578.1 prolyl-tRNA editing enzyme YbaK/EbsC (Cys-tRNA(Pro) deacylase) [Kineococcus radiotolerans]